MINKNLASLSKAIAIMKSLQAANALLRSGASTCNALSRTTPLLSSRIASPSSIQSQFTSPLVLTASHGLPSRSFSSTSAQYKKKNKDKTQEPQQESLEEDTAAAEEPNNRREGGKGKNHKKEKFPPSRASKDTPPKREREAAAAAQQAQQAQAASVSSSNADPNRPFPDPENPFDFADLIYTFDKAEAYHTSELSKIKNPPSSGGGSSLAVETIGAIPVIPDRKVAPHVTYPLRELAAIASLGGGRKYSILAFEESSIKPIMSAVQTSAEFNQQPQKSEENPLELIITVDPERAEQLVKRVKDVCLNWRGKIRDVSHKREALHKKWKTAGVIVNDDLHRLKEKVQKLQDERMKVVLAKEKEALAAVAKR
ncbi:Ribosome recycling factor domain containing protein [Rhypophila sp. PSN 637]